MPYPAAAVNRQALSSQEFFRNQFQILSKGLHRYSRVRLFIGLSSGLLIGLCLLLAACTEKRSEKGSTTVFTPEMVTFTDVTDEVGLDFQHGAFRWDISGDTVAMMAGG
jgi:hypothetical protein